jgi:hypothetical protein
MEQVLQELEKRFVHAQGCDQIGGAYFRDPEPDDSEPGDRLIHWNLKGDRPSTVTFGART